MLRIIGIIVSTFYNIATMVTVFIFVVVAVVVFVSEKMQQL